MGKDPRGEYDMNEDRKKLRKPKDKYSEHRSISMEKRVWEIVDKMSEKTGLSRSVIVERACKEFIKRKKSLLQKKSVEDFIDDFF